MVTTYREVVYRYVADLFTFSRFFLAMIFVWCGLTQGKEATSAVIFGILIGWTSDVLDGVIGRLSDSQTESCGARLDFVADMVMVYGSLIFFTLAGYVSGWAFVFYTLTSGILIKKFPNKSVVMTLATPAVALPLVISILYEPLLRWVFIVWIIVMLVFDWDRFVEVVEEYVQEMNVLFKK